MPSLWDIACVSNDPQFADRVRAAVMVVAQEKLSDGDSLAERIVRNPRVIDSAFVANVATDTTIAEAEAVEPGSSTDDAITARVRDVWHRVAGR